MSAQLRGLAADALDNDPLLTSSEVAALFRVDQKTVSRWVGAGRVPSLLTPGGHHRFRRSVIDEILSGARKINQEES